MRRALPNEAGRAREWSGTYHGCHPGGGGGPHGRSGGGGGPPHPGPRSHGRSGGGGGPPRQSWQLFQSQLLPQPGSQNSPGHHCGNGPGAATASAAMPTPARPATAAPAKIVAATREIIFTRALLPARGRPKTIDASVSSCQFPANPAAGATVTSGRSGTRTGCAPPAPPCGSARCKPGTVRRHAGKRRCGADPAGTTANRDRARAAPR